MTSCGQPFLLPLFALVGKQHLLLQVPSIRLRLTPATWVNLFEQDAYQSPKPWLGARGCPLADLELKLCFAKSFCSCKTTWALPAHSRAVSMGCFGGTKNTDPDHGEATLSWGLFIESLLRAESLVGKAQHCKWLSPHLTIGQARKIHRLQVC